MPDDKIPGVYADFVSVWHTADAFTFDFAALARPPSLVEGDDGPPTTQAQAQVVARVRVPPSQVFEIMKALERQLTAWEKETGRRPPRPPAAPEAPEQ
jgi:hypothetical protein